jgi:phosphatidylserine/phosphatidylglycerophosphate/cardiolipin synthase-like enzyme
VCEINLAAAGHVDAMLSFIRVRGLGFWFGASVLAVISAVTACGGGSSTHGGGFTSTSDGGGGTDSTDDGGSSTMTDGGGMQGTGSDGGSSSGTDAGSGGGGIVPSTAVTIHVEPTGDHGKLLTDAINGATKSIHMTMYLVTLSTVVSALTARKAAGVDVKVILNQTFPTAGDSNASILSQLKSGNVDVIYASPAFKYTHEKAMVVDGTTAWIMTANATASSYDSNREYLAEDTDANDVAELETIFADDFAATGYVSNSPTSTPTIPGSLIVAPAPPMNSLPALVGLISGAKQSVYAEVEEIDNYKIANALVAAKKNGATVNLVVANSTDNTGTNTTLSGVKAGGCTVTIGGGTTSSSTQSNPYIHAKAIVVDGSIAWVGSENFTTGSLEYNREVGVFFSTASEVAKVETAIKADVAGGKPF